MIQSSSGKTHPQQNRGHGPRERLFKICGCLFGDMVESLCKCGTRQIREAIEIADDRRRRDTGRQKVICAAIHPYKGVN